MRSRRWLFTLPLVLAALYAASAAPAAPPAPPSAAPGASSAVPATTAAPVASASVSAAPVKGAPSMTVDKLDNGLTVVTVPMPGTGVVAYFTLVKAGSRDEVEKGRSGYAHLFEHLMFRGTEKVPAREYEHKMQAMGADNNAYTTGDYTLYVPVLPKESLGDLVPIEADRFQRLKVAENHYKDETGAVLGELNKSMSSPGWFMEEALGDLAFQKHTYGHTTIGYKADVEAMPKNYSYSKTFFSRFYTPDNCVIWVVGDVTRDKALSLVKASYSEWKGKRAEPKIAVEPEQKEARRKDLTWKGPTTPRLTIGYKIPAASASLADVAALAVTSTLVFGEPGDLYQKVVVRDQKVIELASDPDSNLNKDPGLFRVDAKLKAGTSFDDVLTEVQAALDATGRGQAKAADVESARAHLVSALTLAMQTPGSVAERLANLCAVTGDVRGFERYLAELRKVTPEDVARVTKAYLVPARRSTITLSPPKAPDPGEKKADAKPAGKDAAPAAKTTTPGPKPKSGGKK